MNILITGGSSGLGRATVELLANEAQHNILFTYYQQKEDAETLTKNYDNVSALGVDFSNTDSVNKLCVAIEEMSLDVLVNSAYSGSLISNHFHKINPNEFMESFSHNIIPTIKVTQAAIAGFRKKRFGKIINVLTSALLGLPPIGTAIYVSNKAYLQELSKVWNKEFSKYNITSNCISPEYMNTGFANTDDRILEQMIKEHPLNKLLTVEEVAFVIKFLIESSQQVNGINIPINNANNS